MAYSAYCDTASATKWWVIGTGSSVNRLSEIMDDNASGVEEADNPGNYQPWSTFMVEVVEDAIYRILLPFEIGNGSTATVLLSSDEHIYFSAGAGPKVKANATLTIGQKEESWGRNGSFWSISGDSGALHWFCDGGTLNIYASMIKHLSDHVGYIGFKDGAVEILNSVFSNSWNEVAAGDKYKYRWYFADTLTSIIIKSTFFNNCWSLEFLNPDAVLENVWVHDCAYFIYVSGVDQDRNITISEMTGSDAALYEIGTYTEGGDIFCTCQNALFTISSVHNDGTAETGLIKETYTVNISVAKPDGTLFDDEVTVTCKDTNGDTVFSETTSGGYITEQVVERRRWVGLSETLTNYTPHDFTVSAPGYETLELNDITIDHPIKWWHLELAESYPQVGETLIDTRFRRFSLLSENLLHEI